MSDLENWGDINFRAYYEGIRYEVIGFKIEWQGDEKQTFLTLKGHDQTVNVWAEDVLLHIGTGMKAGREEIYLGDIVSSRSFKGKVVYDKGMFLVVDEYGDDEGLAYLDDIEIIGNTGDSPDNLFSDEYFG